MIICFHIYSNVYLRHTYVYIYTHKYVFKNNIVQMFKIYIYIFFACDKNHENLKNRTTKINIHLFSKMLCAIHIKSNMSAAQCAAMGFVAAPKVQHLFHSKQAQQGGSITFKPPHGASPCQLHWQHFFLV